VADRIRLHRTGKDGLGVDEATDFALAFWMLYEVPDQAAFLAEVIACVKPGSRLLVVEPRLHVSGAAFERSGSDSAGAGQLPVARPAVALSRAVLFSR
jgi:hypothetical protein